MSFKSHSGTTPFKKYADKATGGESQAVCKFTATKIANQVKLNPKASIRGKIIGIIIITIGTHSKGQPSKKIIIITIPKIRYLFISKDSKNSVKRVGVPNLANTAPKKFEAATKTIISAVISKVFTKASCNLDKVNFLYAIESNNAPIAPHPAASVGVAKPNKILPKAAKTNAAGGTKPRKNSIQTSFMVAASNFFGAVFARLGTPMLLTEFLLSLEMNKYLILAIVMGVIFLLGWPLEWVPIVMIIVPIILPLIEALGFNLTWFAILVAVNLQTAWLSPPVALSAYFLKGVVPEWDLKDIYLGMMQFMVLQVIGLIIIIIFPKIVLWLPTVLYGQ